MTTLTAPVIPYVNASTGPMLDIADLCVAYGQSQIIKNVSISVPRGQTVAVLGRNGMGKTTLMKSLIGILKAQSGRVSVDGHDVTRLPSWTRVKRGLAFVPQGRQIFNLMSVKENILTGLETVSPKKIDPELYETFPVLKEMGRRRGGNLSGGQQQQLAIARALSSNPKVLLLDEPTEGIQPSVIKDIARTLNQIKRKRDLTVLVSEQILSFALDIADRILVVEGGRIVHAEDRATVDERRVARFLSI